MKTTYTYSFVFLFSIVIFLTSSSPIRAQILGSPIGKTSYITDEGVYGSVYDPDCPNEQVDIHVYQTIGEFPVICRSGYSCPWGLEADGGVCRTAQTGFWCIYRHPVNQSSVPAAINVTALNKCGDGEPVQLNPYNYGGTQVPMPFTPVYHDRANNTVFVDKPSYKIGISKRYGAGVVEFYNKRVDPTMNLIQPDPGALFVAALFGDSAYPIGSAPTCVGNSDTRYNPTQGGSHCLTSSDPNTGRPIESTVLSCTTETGADCMNTLSYTGNWLRYYVHFRNFYYSQAAGYPYQPFDDVYGFITYTFFPEYVQIDYEVEKKDSTTYGLSFQQMPTAYVHQLTKFIYKDNGQIITNEVAPATSHSIFIDQGAKDGRWVTAKMSTANPNFNDNFLTLGFYNKPILEACQPTRKFQVDHLLHDSSSQYTGVVQNDNTFVLQKGIYEFRALIFPYQYDETVPGLGKTTANLVDIYDTNGGLMPTWECNMPTVTTLKSLINAYLSAVDSQNEPVDTKINMLDISWMIDNLP